MSLFPNPPARPNGPHVSAPEPVTLARATDPATSHAAAEHAVSSGLVGRQHAEVVRLVRDYRDCVAGAAREGGR